MRDRKTVRARSLPVIGALALALLACSQPDGAPDPGARDPDSTAATSTPKPVVAATARPAEWLLRSLAGDSVEIRAFLPAGVSGESYQPAADEIARLSNADLIVAQGAGYEPWLGTASLPESRLVVLTEGLDLIEIEGETHSHAGSGEHSHLGADWATYEDPALVRQSAATLRQALDRVGVPAEPLTTAFADLERELQSLEAEIERLRPRLAGWKAVAAEGHHRYLMRALGVPLRAVEWTEGGTISHHDRGHLEDWLGADRALALWQGDPGERAGELPSSLRHVVLGSLDAANGADYADRLRGHLERIEDAID